jgi:hypothetical protein
VLLAAIVTAMTAPNSVGDLMPSDTKRRTAGALAEPQPYVEVRSVGVVTLTPEAAKMVLSGYVGVTPPHESCRASVGEAALDIPRAGETRQREQAVQSMRAVGLDSG